MIDLFIRTRGLVLGYQFLIKKPNFSQPIFTHTDLDKPTCILVNSELNPSEIHLFLYGIPSARKDEVGAPIKYELVARISPQSTDSTQKEKDFSQELTTLVWLWLNEVKTTLTQSDNKRKLVQIPLINKSQLGQLLDDKTYFPEKYIETILDATYNQNWTDKQKRELDNKLVEFIQQITYLYPYTEKKSPGKMWCGGINDRDSREIWIKLVNKILKGETQGKALLLNGATPKSLKKLSFVKEQEVGVLVAKEYSELKPNKILVRKLNLLVETTNKNKVFILIFILLMIVIIILLSQNSALTTTNEKLIRDKNQLDSLVENLQTERDILMNEINIFKNSNIPSISYSFPNTLKLEKSSLEFTFEPPSNDTNPILEIQGKYLTLNKLTRFCVYSVINTSTDTSTSTYYSLLNNNNESLKASNSECDSINNDGSWTSINDDGSWEFTHNFDYSDKRNIKLLFK